MVVSEDLLETQNCYWGDARRSSRRLFGD